MGIDGKVAVVTGSSAGIGKATVLRLAQRGIKVVVTSRDVERAAAVVDQIEATGGRALAAKFDLLCEEDGDALVQTTLAAFGRLDYLVNNAFSYETLPPIPIQELSADQMVQGITTNVTRTLVLTGRCHSALKETRGRVLTIGSVVVNRAMLGIPLYSIAKGALTEMTKVLAAEWAQDGITVNQINPGVVWSDAHKSIGIPEEQVPLVYDYYSQFHPLGRVGKPDDVAELATSILLADSDWMTGAVVDLDGGYSRQGIPLPGA